MIKLLTIKKAFATIILLGCLAISARSQTVQFSMDVQPELGIEVLQDLNFGTVIANSGTHRVLLGDVQMGIFKIKALTAQSALLTLQKPDHLAPTAAGIQKNIPVSIYAAYSDQPNSYNNVLNFRDNSLQVSLGNDNASLSPTWETGYVFIFGDIEVGEVSEGSYSGTLILNVTYQ